MPAQRSFESTYTGDVMKAITRYCKFLDRGVECWRAPMDGSRACGCKPQDMAIQFRSGLSRSHRRKIRRQLREKERASHH